MSHLVGRLPGRTNVTLRPGRIRRSFHKAATYTLLDAAALASTAPLDLSDPAAAPDFIALSFYKIFGFPDLGALIVRKDSAHVLQSRRYFGGGTVEMVISINDTWHAKKDTTLHDRLEDGTLPFHAIFALDHAITVHEKLYGHNPMKFISMHTAQLGKQMYDGMCTLRHSNGSPLVRIYKDDGATYGDPFLQGATVAFNVLRADGSLVGFEDVEEAADDRKIYVRSGSLCNPGGMAAYLDWSPAEMRTAYASGHRCSNPTQVVLGKPTGVVRASLGAMSVARDVAIFLDFLRDAYLDQTAAAPLAYSQASSTLTSYPKTYQITQLTALPGPLSTGMPPSHALDYNNTPKSPGGATSSSTNPEDDLITTALPESDQPPERQKAPPFIPADYVKLRKPWEEEMRKQYPNVGMEIKVREFEDASNFSRNQTPSVKARKFGRSVVNLLRTKSHLTEARYDQRPT